MAIRRYEIDLGKGILKANDPDDHQRMMEALSVLQAKTSEPLQKPPAVPPSTKSGLRLGELLDKFLLLKTHLTQATVIAYKATIEEFSGFVGRGFQRGAASLAHRNPKRSEVGSHSE